MFSVFVYYLVTFHSSTGYAILVQQLFHEMIWKMVYVFLFMFTTSPSPWLHHLDSLIHALCSVKDTYGCH